MLRKLTGVGLRANRLDAVYNYRKISDRLHTSGQPSAGQFSAIRDAGFKHIVNLAPHGTENALADEAAVLSALGLEYFHIPVDFNNPTEEDFAQFVAILQAQENQPLWVHCAANMRVSVFIYRYRRDILKEAEELIRKDLNAIWEPFGVWRKFLGFSKKKETEKEGYL